MNPERTGRHIEPPIDLLNILDRTKAGDEDAATELYSYLRSKLLGFFGRRLPGEAEDLTQETLAGIVVALPRFDPALARGELSRSFGRWVFTIARNTLNMEFRRAMKMRTRPFSEAEVRQGVADKRGQDETKKPEVLLEDVVPRFKERLKELLSPEQFQAVELRMAGEDIEKIAQKLNIPQRAVINRLSRARETIEGKLIYPVGFRQIADYEDGVVLVTAARKGSLEAVKFLGLWYTTDEWVRHYQQRRALVAQTILDTGYLLLSQHTTPDEYGTLLNPTHARLLVRRNGRVYIAPEDLESFRSGRRRVGKRIESPGDEYRPLGSFAVSPAEYERLNLAARSGELPAEKKGRWWFARPEDVVGFLAIQRQIRPAKARADDEVQIIRAITVYDASKLVDIPEGEFSNTFREWFFTVAKVVSDQRLPWRKRRKLPQPHDLEAAINIFTVQLKEWLDKKGVSIHPSSMQVVNLKLRGKRSMDIVQEIGWKTKSVRATINRARKTIENNLLYPAGIKRVSGFGDNSLDLAAITGRFEAVWFLGRWYTTEERVVAYRSKNNDPQVSS